MSGGARIKKPEVGYRVAILRVGDKVPECGEVTWVGSTQFTYRPDGTHTVAFAFFDQWELEGA